MHYDPIKNSLGRFFNSSPFLRKLFYHLLDLLLLRTWHIHKELKSWFRDHPAPADILDAGSGFGQYSYYMAKKGKAYSILSVDVKEEQVADCNDFFGKIGLNNVHFQVEDLTVFRKPGSFNLVLCVDVMEHILEDVEVFKNFHADLKPGGMVLISTPSDQGGSDVSGEGEESFIGEHVRDGYNIDEIQQKLRSAGFNRTEARYAYGTPGKIAWRLSMKYPIMALNASKLFFILLPFYYLIAFPVSFVLNYIDTNSAHPTGTGLIVKAWK
jgi:2-polyprenyl-3-methyl-5-hydroxy-6-metoxy-1,4-benzoquinol methylase